MLKRNKQNVSNLRVIKQPKMVDPCFGALALNAELKSKEGKLDQPVLGAGVMDTVAGTALDMFVHHGLPSMGKKAVEMGRYYGSETLRNPKLQKKAIDYALDKLKPVVLLNFDLHVSRACCLVFRHAHYRNRGEELNMAVL